MTPEKVDLARVLAQIPEVFQPRAIACANGQELRLARLHGEFHRHRHTEADEVFLVLAGTLEIRFDDGLLVLEPGQLAVVPRGTFHQPIAREEVHVMLFEPVGTVSTGDG